MLLQLTTHLRFAPNLHLSLSVITFRHHTQPFLERVRASRTRSFRLPAAASLPLSGTRPETIDFLDAGRSLLTFSSPFPRTL
jgi:hypothetical protein